MFNSEFNNMSAVRKGIVTAYDITTFRVVKITKTEFDELKINGT